MTLAEVNAWRLYREKRGYLSDARRSDLAIARLAGVVCGAMGIKKQDGTAMSVRDFLPFEDAPKIDSDLLSVFKSLGGKR